MAASIRVEVSDAQVRAALGRLLEASRDLSPAMDEIGTALVASTQLRFERGVGPDGRLWPPSIRVRVEGGLTLVHRGHLRGGITHVFDRESVTVGTNARYAGVHQFGATIRAKTPISGQRGGLRFKVAGRWVRKREVAIPPRPFLGLDQGDRDEVLEILTEHHRAAFAGGRA